MRSKTYWFGAFAALLAMPGLAQAADYKTMRKLVTVERLESQTLVAKTEDGKTETFAMTPDAGVFYNKKATAKDVKLGNYIASTAVKGTDGKWHVTDLRIFPDVLRGLGEGQRPMNEAKTQIMTNASVTSMSMSGETATLKVKWPDMESELVVDPETPVIAVVPGERAMVKVGSKVQINIITYNDGRQISDRIILQ